MSVPKAFAAQLYFHAMALRSREVEIMMLKIVRNAMNSTMTGIENQLMRKA